MDRGELTAGAGGRLMSVDALRGFTMFWIIGGDAELLQALAALREHNNGKVLFLFASLKETDRKRRC